MDKVDRGAHPSGVKQDRPLHGEPYPHNRLHPRLYAAELVGAACRVGSRLPPKPPAPSCSSY
jgi:hypothetical protein